VSDLMQSGLFEILATHEILLPIRRLNLGKKLKHKMTFE
jgi:hypothetical protein